MEQSITARAGVGKGLKKGLKKANGIERIKVLPE
jgi:hypothetical protein